MPRNECKADAHLLPGGIPSMARRGSAAMRASFLLGLPGRAMLAPAFLAALILSGPAHAGGLAEVAPDVDPCPPIVSLDTSGMTAQMIRDFWAVRKMSGCRRLFFDRYTGEALSDAEIMRRMHGPDVPPVSEVPLPGAVWGMLLAFSSFLVLAWRRRAI